MEAIYWTVSILGGENYVVNALAVGFLLLHELMTFLDVMNVTWTTVEFPVYVFAIREQMPIDRPVNTTLYVILCQCGLISGQEYIWPGIN